MREEGSALRLGPIRAPRKPRIGLLFAQRVTCADTASQRPFRRAQTSV